MTQVTSLTESAATREIDLSARRPIGLLLASALLWLVLSGLLSLLTAIQTYTPSFLANCEVFTYGRSTALQETSFIYGWAANAAVAVAVWILARLGGAPLRGRGLLKIGTIFWNVGVAIGLIGIAKGDGTGIAFLQMPAYVHPLLLIAYAAMAVPGVLAWTGRRHEVTFAAQWYAVAALFLFPWLYSAAQAMLLVAPVRGTAQAVVATWFAQNLLSLWLLPTALAAAYYLVPKLTGRTISSYEFARHGFWTLLFFESWTGARHLVGGPVPAWIPTLAIVCATLVLFHYMIVALNLRGVLRGGSHPALSFVSSGFIAYVLGGIAVAVFAFQGLAETVQFTFFPLALLKLSLTGAFSLLVFGAIYYLVPHITGCEWPSSGLIRGHWVVTVLGVALTVVSLAVAGWVQGQALNDAAVNFAGIASRTKPWLLAATAGEALLLLGALIVTVHYFLQFASCASSCCPSGTMEASAS